MKKKSFSKTHSSDKKKTSSNVQTWEKFLKNKESKELLQKCWKAKNPQKIFEQSVKKLHRRYSLNKKV